MAETLGARLRRQHRLSQQDLADRAGLSLAGISGIETGAPGKAPDVHTMMAMAHALGMTVDDLLSDADVPRLDDVQSLLDRLGAMLPTGIPFVGDVSAGEGLVDLDPGVFIASRRYQSHRFIRVCVSGRCMEPDLPAGCQVDVDKEAHPQIGDAVVFRRGGEDLCKRLKERNGSWRFVADVLGAWTPARRRRG